MFAKDLDPGMQRVWGTHQCAPVRLTRATKDFVHCWTVQWEQQNKKKKGAKRKQERPQSLAISHGHIFEHYFVAARRRYFVLRVEALENPFFTVSQTGPGSEWQG